MLRCLVRGLLAVSFLMIASASRADDGVDHPRFYLVYAGPYVSSPSSAFGHLFLVLQPDDAVPVPLWDVISFSAETGDAGPLRYLAVGITGGFLGSYRTHKFHEKVRDYGVLQDRDLWLLRIRLASEETRALQRAVDEVKGQWYPYVFFTRNCATYLQHLLSRALVDVPEPRGSVSPISVLELVIASGRAEECYFQPAISQHIAEAARRLPGAAVDVLRHVNWTRLAADTLWTREQTPPVRAFLQQYFQWKSLRSKIALDSPVQAGMDRLRYQNTREHNAAFPGDSEGPIGVAGQFPRFHHYWQWTASCAVDPDGGSRVGLRCRPFLHAITEPWYGYRPVNTMEALALRVSSRARRWTPRLEEFVLFMQRSLRPANWPTGGYSWLLGALLRRGAPFRRDAIHGEIQLGAGRCGVPLGHVYCYVLATGSFLAARETWLTFAPGFQAGSAWLPSATWRLGVQWDRYVRLSGSFPAPGLVDAWIRRDLGPRFGATVGWRRSHDERQVHAEIAWNP
jgi:hypothetical protein